MKKLLIMASMFLFVVPANAYYVTTMQHGGYNSINTYNNHLYNNNLYNNNTNFGSNASFLPQNVQRAGMQQRQIEYERKYLDSLKDAQNINVNVNHRSYPPAYYNNGYYTNTYYNNGYNRYYNNGYIQPNRIYYNRGNGMTFPGVRVFN